MLFEKALEKMTQVFKTRYPEMAGGCFIAGTLVHTDKGLVPIEQIKVGDMVLSKPEQGGECCYKKVLKTFAHEDKPICAVKYMLIGGGVHYGHPDYMPYELTIHHCYATPNHPFFEKLRNWGQSEVFFATDRKRHASEQACTWKLLRSDPDFRFPFSPPISKNVVCPRFSPPIFPPDFPPIFPRFSIFAAIFADFRLEVHLYPHCVMSARIQKSPAQCDKT